MRATLLLILTLAIPAWAQRKVDYMSEPEQEMARQAQSIDNRAAVYLKIADRRIVALTAPATKLSGREIEHFGPLPTGSERDLLDDYRRAIDELMAKFDDAYDRNGKDPAFQKAVAKSLPEIYRQKRALEALGPGLKTPDAERYLERAIEAASTLAEGLAATSINPHENGAVALGNKDLSAERSSKAKEGWRGARSAKAFTLLRVFA